jgi:hypothetical protein
MGVRLHQRPVFCPALPPARGNGCDVTGMALRSALEIVSIDEWWVLAHSLQYEEAPEQPHRRPLPHEHLTEVDEDGPQYSSSVRKKEDSGGISPARAYTAKKTKSPGLMLASDVAPCNTHFLQIIKFCQNSSALGCILNK